MSPDSSEQDSATAKKTFLPKIGSWKYHLLLGSVAIFILGPLGGITASYMNFSLGFFVGGLLGVLGVFILVLAKPRQTEIDRVARSQGLVPCPHCAEPIKREARVCRYCRRDVAPAPGGPA